jgi:sulfate permease, SulP family
MNACRVSGIFPRPTFGDLVAGVTVAVVLVPQSMAYASLAGMPPERGLLAALLPVVAGGLLASSRYLQTGPTAITALLTFGAVSVLATPGSDEYIGLVIVLTLMVGLVRLGIGLMRWGGVAYLMSQTVVTGFVTAAALLIIASQLPTALGTVAQHRNPLVSAGLALGQPGAWGLLAAAIAAGAFAIVFAARRVHPLMPGPLLAVAAMAGLAALIGYEGQVIGRIGLPAPFADVAVPLEHVPALVVPAAVIAVLGFAEPASIARRYATLDRERWSPGREFVSQGVANLASGFSGAFPVGGSFSRTALARLAGARSRWSFVATAVVVAAMVPLLPLVAALPTAVLAAIVIAAVVSLIDLRAFAFYWRVSHLQFGVAALTFVATLATAPRIEIGVMIGVAAAIGAHLLREGTIHAEAWAEGRTVHLRPSGVLFFASAPKLQDLLLDRLAAHPEADHVAVHLDRLGRVDVSGAMILRDVLADIEESGMSVQIHDIPEQTRRVVTRVCFTYLGPPTAVLPPTSSVPGGPSARGHLTAGSSNGD